jgi:hypothetical protein
MGYRERACIKTLSFVPAMTCSLTLIFQVKSKQSPMQANRTQITSGIHITKALSGTRCLHTE